MLDERRVLMDINCAPGAATTYTHTKSHEQLAKGKNTRSKTPPTKHVSEIYFIS